MGAPEVNTTLIYGIHIRESANDGSDFTNAASDYRVLFLGEDGSLKVKDSSGTVANAFSAGGTTSNYACQGRLTLTTGVPITTTDVTAATTLYFTPFRGNQIATYSGSSWTLSTFTEKSISLAGLTAGLPYDVFIVDSTLALELLAWTNATTRATALTTQDGVLCKTGALTRRYLGTICIKATGQCEDSLLNRLVWNYYNRTERPMQVFDGTDSWTYNSATWRQARATSGNKVELVIGVVEDLTKAVVQALSTPDGATGVGVDVTNANSAQIFHNVNGSANAQLNHAEYRGYLAVGYHYLAWLEYARTGTVTFNGDQGVADTQTGLVAVVWA